MFPLRLIDASRAWLPAGAAAVLWALAAGSAALWWLHFPGQEAVHNSSAGALAPPSAAQSAAGVARALGHTRPQAAAPDAQRRFQLLGVIATDAGHGSALLSVDGQPAQAFVQGQTVAEGWHLQSVARESARLSAGTGGAVLDVSLPGMDSRSSRE